MKRDVAVQAANFPLIIMHGQPQTEKSKWQHLVNSDYLLSYLPVDVRICPKIIFHPPRQQLY